MERFWTVCWVGPDPDRAGQRFWQERRVCAPNRKLAIRKVGLKSLDKPWRVIYEGTRDPESGYVLRAGEKPPQPREGPNWDEIEREFWRRRSLAPTGEIYP